MLLADDVHLSMESYNIRIHTNLSPPSIFVHTLTPSFECPPSRSLIFKDPCGKYLAGSSNTTWRSDQCSSYLGSSRSSIPCSGLSLLQIWARRVGLGCLVAWDCAASCGRSGGYQENSGTSRIGKVSVFCAVTWVKV